MFYRSKKDPNPLKASTEGLKFFLKEQKHVVYSLNVCNMHDLPLRLANKGFVHSAMHTFTRRRQMRWTTTKKYNSNNRHVCSSSEVKHVHMQK